MLLRKLNEFLLLSIVDVRETCYQELETILQGSIINNTNTATTNIFRQNYNIHDFFKGPNRSHRKKVITVNAAQLLQPYLNFKLCLSRYNTLLLILFVDTIDHRIDRTKYTIQPDISLVL